MKASLSLDVVGRLFAAITRASGEILRIAVVDGPAAGGASYGAALMDLVVMSDHARMFVTGPAVIEKVMGGAVTMGGLGGAAVHARQSGVCHLHAPDRSSARRLGSVLRVVYAPQPCPPRATPSQPAQHVPSSPKQVYDIARVVEEIVDVNVELHASWAPNVHTSLATIAGRSVVILANTPFVKAGCLDTSAGDKAARFVRLCDSLGIPVLVLVDVPGYLPGVDEEKGAILRPGAKLLHAFADIGVPTLAIVLRQAFGGAYVAMNSAGLGASRVLAWPTVEIDIMSPESSVEILHGRELRSLDGETALSRRAELLARYRSNRRSLKNIVHAGYLDGVIDPATTRSHVSQWLTSLFLADFGRIRNTPL